MTNDEIKMEIGKAAIERKECLDRVSCYRKRLDDAAYALRRLLNERDSPLKENNQDFLYLKTDPRIDAQAFVEAATRADELTSFLKEHNAL